MVLGKVRYSEGAAEGMMKINTMGTYLAGGIILILMAVSIFLVSNTVSIGVAVREEEISIMKLIGAANGFIKSTISGRRNDHRNFGIIDSNSDYFCRI